MKIRDVILASLITVNLLLVVCVVGVALYQSESVAHAGAAVDRTSFLRMCTLRIADDREGLVVIDTLRNKMAFYINVQGRKEIEAVGTPIDLALGFKHPTKP